MDIITLRHERFGTTSVLPASYTPAGRVGARRSVNHALRAGRLAPPSREKQLPYECGMEPTGDARAPISVRFYLVAMVFILFDVEAIFLYPWAFIYRDLINTSKGLYGFAEMMVYIAILLVGHFYLWKKGALDWHKY